MATYDLDEQEQLDSLKAWWKRWGSVTLLALAIVVAAAAGWRYWQNRTLTQSLEAASVYQNLTQSLAANDAKAARAAGAMLIDKYQDTAYAPRAALLLAKLNVMGKDLKSAQSQLEWAASNSKEPFVKDLARLRLATAANWPRWVCLRAGIKERAAIAAVLRMPQRITFSAIIRRPQAECPFRGMKNS